MRKPRYLAIHDISGIPGSCMDRVGEFGSWGDPGGDPNVSSAIFDEVYRACAHSRGQRFRPRLRIRDRSQDCAPAHRWSLISDAYSGICLLSGMPNMAVPILIIAGLGSVSVRLLLFDRTGCLRTLRDLWDLRTLWDLWDLWGLWGLWRYSTYLVAGFTRCSAADRTESGHDPRPIFSLVLTMVRPWCIFIYGLSQEHFAGITILYRMISLSSRSLGAWTPGDITAEPGSLSHSAFDQYLWSGPAQLGTTGYIWRFFAIFDGYPHLYSSFQVFLYYFYTHDHCP